MVPNYALSARWAGNCDWNWPLLPRWAVFVAGNSGYGHVVL